MECQGRLPVVENMFPWRNSNLYKIFIFNMWRSVTLVLLRFPYVYEYILNIDKANDSHHSMRKQKTYLKAKK